MKFNKKQHSVIKLALSGKSFDEIGEKLKISPSMAKYFLRRSFLFFDARNRVELLIKYGEYRSERGLGELIIEEKNKKFFVS